MSKRTQTSQQRERQDARKLTQIAAEWCEHHRTQARECTDPRTAAQHLRIAANWSTVAFDYQAARTLPV